METRNIFFNISPLDHRYSLSEASVFESLSEYISEQAAVISCAKAEIALIKAHLSIRNELTPERERELDQVIARIEPAEVYKEEEKTKHNIRALVNVMKTKVSADVAPLVHLGATSVDILDTALSVRVRDCVQQVILPLLKELELHLCTIACNFTPF